MNLKRIVPDTSCIINGKLTGLIKKGKIKNAEIILPEFVFNELENQANHGREIGDMGLAEIKELRNLTKKRKSISLVHKGRLPTMEEINLAKSGRIDALIRKIAETENATLFTSDKVQYMVAEAKGIKCEYFEPEISVKFSLEGYFDEDTMSVHLKKDCVPVAKKGQPGNMKLVKIRDKEMTGEEIENIIKETVEKAKSSEKGFIEMNKRGLTVLQIEDLRIVITKPPFSDSPEITAVKPVKKLPLEYYNLSTKLMKRLDEKAEGILIAGAPGHGKSTFAQALAEHYMRKKKVVKTMEQPRDLQVRKEITQYNALEGNFANTADILLLVRPDYTVFDEIRKTRDFEIYADLRLAGVGMIGVVHASKALDAIQRLIGRVDLGVIPQIVDTVIFIQNGQISKVFKMDLTVKVPEGMTQEDLARPVILVKDFETEKVEYEIYTFGEETMVIPVEETKKSGKEKFATEYLKNYFSKYITDPQIEFLSENHVKVLAGEEDIPYVIGKGGARIEKIEKKLGLHISIEPKTTTLKSKSKYILEEVGNSLVLIVGKDKSGKVADVYNDEEFLFSATIGKNGQIRITKDFELAKRILGAHSAHRLKIYL